MDKSAIVLSGSLSSRFEDDKATLELRGKPLIKHVVDTAAAIVDEIIVVTDSQERQDKYAKILEPNVKFVLESPDAQGPLIGAVAGLSAAQGKYSLLLPADSPFVSADVLTLFFELCHGKSAVIPRWPDQKIEPLQAVYQTKTALEAAKMALADGLFDLEAMVENMGGIRYVSTLVVQEMDPELKTFFNVNTPIDLKIAETLSRPKPWKVKAEAKKKRQNPRHS